MPQVRPRWAPDTTVPVELVAMPQKPAGPVQVAGFQKGADVGGGDGDALQAVLRNDGAANPQLGAGLQQPGGGAFPPAPKRKSWPQMRAAAWYSSTRTDCRKNSQGISRIWRSK